MILTVPNPLLAQKCKPIDLITGSVKANIAQMLSEMYGGGGIGLAAPQIGWLANVFVIDIDDGKGPRVFINPQLYKHSVETEIAEEGCLSIPGRRVRVKRSTRVEVCATDITGKFFTIQAGGLLARCVQHEANHLQGRTILEDGEK